MSAGGATTWTILSVLHWAQHYLQSKGISEPRAGAEVLLAHCLHCSRLELYLRHDQPLSDDELSCYKKGLKRRLAFEPTQYITGHQEFWSLDFLVSPAVLIPRPETELLVEAILNHLRRPDQQTAAPRILDVGTGSGVLAVTLATELPQAQLVAVDCSWEALEMARNNARCHGVEPQITWVLGNLVEFLSPQMNFDAIVSNPPYVPTADWEQLPPDIKNYEPRLALDGGPDGMDVIRKLIPAVSGRLQAGGVLALELGQGQAETAKEIMDGQRILAPAAIIQDYQRIGRVVLARRLEPSKSKIE